MVEAGVKYNRIIQCGTQNRSAAYAFSARDYIQSGKLGEVVAVKTYCMLPGSKQWFLKPDSAVPLCGAGLETDFKRQGNPAIAVEGNTPPGRTV